MAQKNLHEWLIWIKNLHSHEIDLSLERVSIVAKRLNCTNSLGKIIIVAGTNGKGSTVAGLEAIYLEAGFKVGTFTSPFLYSYNEQIRIQGQLIKDADLCRAFSKIEEKIYDLTLTAFEFGTLAAIMLLNEANLDIAIFEVGLGGRFDAVNILEADVAIVTSIAMDHMQWLGNTREAIAFEKAGIFRAHKPAICGDFQPPVTLLDYATHLNAPLFCQGQHFGFTKKTTTWDFWSAESRLENCPLPQLALQNMATVLMAVELLQEKLPVSHEVIKKALAEVSLAGRIETVPGSVTRILDVAHNPAAVQFLASSLKDNPNNGKTVAVFSMYADKDIVQSITAISTLIDHWFVAPLAMPRGASLVELKQCFEKASVNHVDFFSSIKAADQAAITSTISGDRIVVFGSFATVAALSENTLNPKCF